MKVITFGRSSRNNIVINDSKVSRVHCQIIQYDNGGFGIIDFNSTNGTFVNGRRITGEVKLHQNDIVQIGNTRLQWQQYFKTDMPPKPNYIWIWGVAATVVSIIFLVGGLLFYNHYSQRDIIFEGEYPPVKTITITENGEEYAIGAFAGQLEVIFAENVPINSARSQIKSLGGKIIAQIPDMHYFLVEVAEGSEAYFLQQVKNISKVSYAFLHTPLFPCHANIAVIDNFSYINEDGNIHGDNVAEAARIGCDNCATWQYDAGSKTDGRLYSDTIAKHLDEILKKLDEPLVINMSFGKSLDNDKKWNEKTTTETERNSYIKNYKEDIISLIEKLKPYHDKGKDFVITKSSGNEGCDVFDEEILNSLYKSFESEPWRKEIFDQHIVLVGSIDNTINARKENGKAVVVNLNETEKDAPVWVKTYGKYGNRPVNYNPMYTAYDISHLSYKNGKSVDGTSFSSPEVAGQIARLIDEYEITAVGALEIVKIVTKENARATGTPGILDALELDKKARQVAYKYKRPAKITDNVSVTDEPYKPKSETYNIKDTDKNTTKITTPSGKTTTYTTPTTTSNTSSSSSTMNELIGTKWEDTKKSLFYSPNMLEFINNEDAKRTIHSYGRNGEVVVCKYYYNVNYNEWRFIYKNKNEEPFRLNNNTLEIYTWHLPWQPTIEEFKRIN